jgi:large subunit ribosomal protein L23
MNIIYNVIKKPLFTEKGMDLKERENKLLVEVNPAANKIEIKKAMEEIFNVKVDKVATIRTKGKKKRMGKYEGRRPNKKKAVITLHEGQKLDFIEGV